MSLHFQPALRILDSHRSGYLQRYHIESRSFYFSLFKYFVSYEYFKTGMHHFYTTKVYF